MRGIERNRDISRYTNRPQQGNDMFVITMFQHVSEGESNEHTHTWFSYCMVVVSCFIRHKERPEIGLAYHLRKGGGHQPSQDSVFNFRYRLRLAVGINRFGW